MILQMHVAPQGEGIFKHAVHCSRAGWQKLLKYLHSVAKDSASAEVVPVQLMQNSWDLRPHILVQCTRINLSMMHYPVWSVLQLLPARGLFPKHVVDRFVRDVFVDSDLDRNTETMADFQEDCLRVPILDGLVIGIQKGLGQS